MPIVTPNTDIFFCSNIPLDNRYQHTLYFVNRQSQSAYFNEKISVSMTGCTYQRQTGRIRASSAISTFMNCNYLFFRNPDFENRTFYCFITGVNYINNETTEVQFEIDVMQTYFLDCTMRQCFIRRGHTSNDVIGNNQIPENLETGEYITIQDLHATALEPMSIVVAATVDENGEAAIGNYYSGVYSGVKLHVFREADAVNDFLRKLTALNKADAVVNIFMMPYTFSVSSGAGVIPKYNEFNVTKPYSTINGYTPKNKKLFCYPYNVLHVTNGEGVSADFRYELFTDSPCKFEVVGSMSTTPQAICYPCNYKGIAKNYDEKLVLDGWPQCAWNIDTYKAWLAQNANLIDWQDNTAEMLRRNVNIQSEQQTQTHYMQIFNSAVTTTGQALQTGAGLAGAFLDPKGTATSKGAAIGGAISSVGSMSGRLANQMYETVTMPVNQTIQKELVENQIAQTLAMREDHATTPPQAVGGGSSTVMMGLQRKTFFIYQKQIRAEFAKMIDDYFTMYGYAQHKVAIPNINARTRYTYIQTQGSMISGNAPVWAISLINQIFDTGITFWHDYSGVGNYTFDNPPIAGGEY